MSQQLRMDHNRANMQKTKRELIDMRGKACQDFCGHLRRLTNMLWSRNKDNDDINSIKRRLNIATNSNPMTIIEIAGPQFFAFRESLTARKIDFFIERDFEQDVYKVQKTHEIEGDSSSANEVINVIKSTFISFSEAEKTIILNTAIDMLSCYARYLVCTKKLNEQKSQQ